MGSHIYIYTYIYIYIVIGLRSGKGSYMYAIISRYITSNVAHMFERYWQISMFLRVKPAQHCQTLLCLAYAPAILLREYRSQAYAWISAGRVGLLTSSVPGERRWPQTWWCVVALVREMLWQGTQSNQHEMDGLAERAEHEGHPGDAKVPGSLYCWTNPNLLLIHPSTIGLKSPIFSIIIPMQISPFIFKYNIYIYIYYYYIIYYIFILYYILYYIYT